MHNAMYEMSQFFDSVKSLNYWIKKSMVHCAIAQVAKKENKSTFVPDSGPMVLNIMPTARYSL